MNFKNGLERQLFESASRVCDGGASIEHNRTIQVEITSAREVASFVGPPRKEIDIITAGFRQSPQLKVLISGKDYSNSKAEPADVQEWGAVISTMNKYSAGTRYLGLIVSPSGFTSGCEPWAASSNLGLVPPLKGERLRFTPVTVQQMFERALRALGRRLQFSHDELFAPPEFYEFVYRLTATFEGRDAAAREYGARYQLLGSGWLSSFGQLVDLLKGKMLREIVTTTGGIFIGFSDACAFRMIGKQLLFGRDDGAGAGEPVVVECTKNFSAEPCTFDFIKGLVVGQRVTSAGDWGDRFEFGLSDDLMLAIEPNRLQVFRTKNPPEENSL